MTLFLKNAATHCSNTLVIFHLHKNSQLFMLPLLSALTPHPPQEEEFHKGPTTKSLESLISINNKLQQPDAAAGVLVYAQKHMQHQGDFVSALVATLVTWCCILFLTVMLVVAVASVAANSVFLYFCEKHPHMLSTSWW